MKLGDLVQIKEQWRNAEFILWDNLVPHPNALGIVIQDWDEHNPTNFSVWFFGADSPVDFAVVDYWSEHFLELVDVEKR